MTIASSPIQKIALVMTLDGKPVMAIPQSRMQSRQAYLDLTTIDEERASTIRSFIRDIATKRDDDRPKDQDPSSFGYQLWIDDKMIYESEGNTRPHPAIVELKIALLQALSMIADPLNKLAGNRENALA